MQRVQKRKSIYARSSHFTGSKNVQKPKTMLKQFEAQCIQYNYNLTASVNTA